MFAMALDEEALELAYRLHYPAIVRFLIGFGGGAVDVEDLAQEAFLRLGRGSDVPSERVRFWLIRVARNLALNELRRRRPVASLDAIAAARDPSRDPEAALLRRDELRSCVDALRDLPEQWRSIVLLRELEEMSYAEIAALLDISIAKVKSDLFRARMRLRELLGRTR